MIYENLFRRVPDRVVRCGLIGPGSYGTAILAQAQSIPRLEVAVVADRSLDAARKAFRTAGIPDDRVVVCDGRSSALRALESGKLAILQDGLEMMDLPLDVVVESTGVAEAGACHAREAIRHGKHVAMVNKEADAAVGPILKRLADAAGVVYTAVDGDQHGLLIGLVSWARSLGLEVVCGGKARDAEFVHDADAGVVWCGQTPAHVAPEDRWALAPIPPGEARRFVEGRRRVLAELPRVAGFDLTEMAIACNCTGLLPETPKPHSPALRIPEIPEALCPVEEGGILRTRGAIEAVTCLRAPHEAGLGGGVYVVVACANDYARRDMGLMSNAAGTASLIYRPHHLCGVETPITILCAGLLGVSTGAASMRPAVDVVARAARHLPAGTVLGTDHSPEMEALLLPAVPLAPGNPAPLHLLTGNRLCRDVPAGALITAADVEAPGESCLWALRRKQDALLM